MRRFEAIIESETAPHTSSLWLTHGKLHYFNGFWKPIKGAFDTAENESLLALKTLSVGDRHLLGPEKINPDKVLNDIATILNSQAPIYKNITTSNGILDMLEQNMKRESKFPLIWDKILFRLENNESALKNNAVMLRHLEEILTSYNDTYISVYIEDADIDNIPSIYYNAHIYAIVGGKLRVYNIDTNEPNTGKISLLKTIDLTLLPAYIDLELGNTEQIKSHNLEQLQKVSGTQFFVHADYGIGVGSFNSGYGGETTIQTASGSRVHYIITAEGECRKQVDRFEHSELFYNLGTIDVASLPRVITLRNSVDIQAFKKATNLALAANNNGSFVDDVSMNQVSVNLVTKQRVYTSPDIITESEQGWNYIKATATSFNDRIEIYLETI